MRNHFFALKRIVPAFLCGKIIFGLLLTLPITGCFDSSPPAGQYGPVFSPDSSEKKTLIFGVSTLAFYEMTDLFVKYLNDHLTSAKVKAIACSNLPDFTNKLKLHYFDFTVINGALALQSENSGYNIAGKISDDSCNKGIILLRKDSPVRDYSDLKGKAISFPSPIALAGTMMPLHYLYENGLDVNRDIQRIYGPTIESCFMNVYMGKTAAATSWIAPWKNFCKTNPEIASKLYVKWETPGIINNALLIRDNMDKKLVAELSNIIFSMRNSEEGKEALEKIDASGFELADSSTYQPLNNFLEQYRTVIK
jgi:phosphonate transport system substrate-binding protein